MRGLRAGRGTISPSATDASPARAWRAPAMRLHLHIRWRHTSLARGELMSKPQRKRPALGALAMLTATFGVGTLAHAGVIVNDTWLDGTRTDPAPPTYSENGVDSDGDLNLESAWFQGGDGTLDPIGPGGPLRGAFSSAASTSS